MVFSCFLFIFEAMSGGLNFSKFFLGLFFHVVGTTERLRFDSVEEILYSSRSCESKRIFFEKRSKKK